VVDLSYDRELGQAETRLDWSNLDGDQLDETFLDEDNNLSNNSNKFVHDNTSTLERLDMTNTHHYYALENTETDMSSV
jgi:hypothetical protein